MRTDPHPALREPAGSIQQRTYLRARQQGHPRSFAAAFADIGEREADDIDKEWGFDREPVQNLRVEA